LRKFFFSKRKTLEFRVLFLLQAKNFGCYFFFYMPKKAVH